MSYFDLGDRVALQRFLFRQRRILCQTISDINHAIEYNKLAGVDVEDDVLLLDDRIEVLGRGVNQALKDIADIKGVVCEKSG